MKEASKIRLAIFASGSGTNAEEIIKYFKNNDRISVNLIVSNKANAYVLERAKKYEIPSLIISKKEINSSDIGIEKLREYKIDFIILAGFMIMVPENILKGYEKRIINIHPALLPKYGGKGMYGSFVHEAVIEAGEKESGISIHYVNQEYDKGEIIFQAKCEVDNVDDANTLAEKIHKLEHYHYPRVIERVVTRSS